MCCHLILVTNYLQLKEEQSARRRLLLLDLMAFRETPDCKASV
jgi:hypothetical protein